MKRFVFGSAALAAAGALSAIASGAMMHPVLAAKLTGMGEHGVVNFQSNASKGQLCWTFDVMTDGVTGASIRDSGGMVVAKLGSTYKAKSCAAVSKKALDLIESKPGSYKVWVDTKAHMGELRGTLYSGMAHM
ncbi:MAG TPA: hypothetical protein VH063_09595 [Gaiellaceae bacterium]|jgi:hypothetical protein|nr:hypothetical protein [Gaiellaceae bacterium]